MIVIGAAALVLFGPDQLPKVAKRAGQVVREVQNTSQSFIREMERAADESERRERYAAEPTPAAAPVVEHEGETFHETPMDAYDDHPQLDFGPVEIIDPDVPHESKAVVAPPAAAKSAEHSFEI